MSDSRIAVGAVVQINPQYDEKFGACFLVVDEVKSWGVQGYVLVPAPQGGAPAYYRVPFEQIEYIGVARWSLPVDDVAEN